MLRQLLKKIIFPVLKPASEWYFSKPRWYSYQGLKVKVNPGVFFPHLTISTKVFLGYLEDQNLKELSILELGAGCGIISFQCSKTGATVTASDISLAAIKNLNENKELLGADIKVVHSDLFDSIPYRFDRVLINPPFYPKNPKTEAEKAWFCGEEFEYFKKLAQQLKSHLTTEGYALMILSEDCELETITSMFKNQGIQTEEVFAISQLGERNFILKLS